MVACTAAGLEISMALAVLGSADTKAARLVEKPASVFQHAVCLLDSVSLAY